MMLIGCLMFLNGSLLLANGFALDNIWMVGAGIASLALAPVMAWYAWE